MAVLNHINAELTHIKEENNIRLNAEFNQLISDNIKDQPAPFIYERIGQKFMHYFIDEMQDTSVLTVAKPDSLSSKMRWPKKRVVCCWLAMGNRPFTAGEVGKRSSLFSLGPMVKMRQNPFQVPKEIQELETNFRSYSEVIGFNNLFFQHTAQFLQNEGYQKLFLDGNKQLVTSKKGGYVQLSFLGEAGR